MTTPDNFAAEPEHYLPQEVDEFDTICRHILRNELAAARKILDRRMREQVAVAENRWLKADALAAGRFEELQKLEADNAALRAENESLRAECGLRQIQGYNEGRAAALLAGKEKP